MDEPPKTGGFKASNKCVLVCENKLSNALEEISVAPELCASVAQRFCEQRNARVVAIFNGPNAKIEECDIDQSIHVGPVVFDRVASDEICVKCGTAWRVCTLNQKEYMRTICTSANAKARHVEADDGNEEETGLPKNAYIHMPHTGKSAVKLPTSSLYDPVGNCELNIDHMNATDRLLDEDVIRQVEEAMNKYGYKISPKTPYADYRKAMKQAGLCKYYCNIPQIKYRQTGQAPCRISQVDIDVILCQVRHLVLNWRKITKASGVKRSSLPKQTVLMHFLCTKNKTANYIKPSQNEIMHNIQKHREIVNRILEPAYESGLIPSKEVCLQELHYEEQK